MKSPLFNLIPFSHAEHPDLQISAQAQVNERRLLLRYQIQGPDVSSVLFPTQPSGLDSPKRKDLLWQHTCFEAFLALPDASTYWELNLTPSGDWNFYRFSDYRQGQIQEGKIQTVHVSRPEPKTTDSYLIEAELDLAHLPNMTHDAAQNLLLGLTVIVEMRDTSKSYWALAHCGEKPDFHLRESFKVIEWSR